MIEPRIPPGSHPTDAASAAHLDQIFGALLREHRLTATLTQAELAERAGISIRCLQDLERSQSQPHRDTLLRLVAALNVDHQTQITLEESARPRPRRRVSLGSTATCAIAPPRIADRDNLPLQLTSFIGRESEVAE